MKQIAYAPRIDSGELPTTEADAVLAVCAVGFCAFVILGGAAFLVSHALLSASRRASTYALASSKLR